MLYIDLRVDCLLLVCTPRFLEDDERPLVIRMKPLLSSTRNVDLSTSCTQDYLVAPAYTRPLLIILIFVS